MKYIMPCVLKSPVIEYHRSLVDDIADRFGLTFTQQQAIPAHFTLKYHFTTVNIGPGPPQAIRLRRCGPGERDDTQHEQDDRAHRAHGAQC